MTICPFTADDRFFLGEGVFETLRIEDGFLCYGALHWQRIKKSASFLNIPFPFTLSQWVSQLNQLIHKKRIVQGGIKVILTSGRAARGLTNVGQQPQLFIETFSYHLQQKPLHLISASWRRDAQNPIYQHKTINYLEAIVAKREALAKGADDVVFFNFNDHLIESATATIFLLHQHRLITPALSCGALPGITRHRLVQLCEKEGIPCEQIACDKAIIQSADAIFLTNSLQGIQRVASLNNLYYRIDHPLIDEFSQLLKYDRQSHRL